MGLFIYLFIWLFVCLFVYLTHNEQGLKKQRFLIRQYNIKKELN